MWKSLSTIAISMSVTTSSVYAQNKVNLPVICPAPQKITEVLTNFKEEIIFAGADTIHNVDRLTTILYLNKETKTYTLLLVAPGEKITCVISSGEMGELIIKEK